MYGFIYETTNNINGMKYIGKCVYARKNGYADYLGSGTYLKRAIMKYGKENFTRKIITKARTKKELENLEEYYIRKYNAVESNEYYNLKETSIGGDTFSNNPNKEKTRELKRKNSMGVNNPQYEKPKTSTMITAVKKANSKAVVANGVLYPSLTQASISLNIPITTLSYRLDSKNPLYKNYSRLLPKREHLFTGNKKRPVLINGQPFDSISQASRTLKLSTVKIRMRLKSSDFPDWKFQ